MSDKHNNDQAAGQTTPFVRLADAYVPWQTYTQAYKPMVALDKGTLFPELYRPYVEKK